MTTTQSELRRLIDQQDAAKLGDFIHNNQELDYSSISPNGASALWWSLMPPKGKTI